MSDEKNKNRLFITLQYRLERPDFHWSILLAPKSESVNRDEKDSYLFHAINSFSPGITLAPGQKPGWRYESKPANLMKSRSITGRVLVAKLSGTESVEVQAQRIDSIIRTVPLVQGDNSWTCRVWVEQALDALKAAGNEFSSIPVLTEGLKNEIRAFGEKAKESILKGKTITHPKDLAQLDLRGH